MKFFKILMIIVLFLNVSTLRANWKFYEEFALMISNQSPKVKELFIIAKEDNHIISENSKFDKAVKNSMDSMHYASLFDYHIDEESDREEVITVVFMIVLKGLGYMYGKDWKMLSHSEEMLWSINALLKQNNATLLTQKEIKIVDQKISPYFKGDYNFKNQINATNDMVMLLENFVKNRGLNLLWFQNISDSYGMFIVKPDVYKALNGKKLGKGCSFSIPYFTLDM